MTFCAPLVSRAEDTDTGRREQIKGWVRLLGDREPTSRTTARQALLGLQRDELPLLRDIVASMQPLRPAQAQPLEEVVTYVVTRAALNEVPHSSEAFLGVSLPSEYGADDVMDFGPGDSSMVRETPSTDTGVPIINRLGGFVAYRYLEDGDIIEAVRFGGVLQSTQSVGEFRAAIKAARVGQDVTFRVRRAARVLEVTFELDAKAVDQRDMQETIENAQSSASDLWQQTFAPLVDPEQQS